MAPSSSSADRRLLHRRPLLCVAAALVLSRLLYYAVGVRFDALSLGGFWQYLDPVLLKTDLLRSLWYLHSQPPLFNVFLGGVLKGFPGHEVAALHAAYMLGGVTLGLAACALMIRLGVSRRLSAVLTIAFSVSPPCILYENWLFYDYPIAVLLCASAGSLHRFASGWRLRHGLSFFGLLACVVLIRSLFHLAWLAAFALMLLIARRRQWRRVLAASCLPLLVVAGWYVKNLCVFGTFGSSTWLGMNFADVTTLRIPRGQRRTLVRDGTLSPLALVQTFRPLDAYREHVPKLGTTGVPALDEERKKPPQSPVKVPWSSRAPNFNHIAYIAVSRCYLRDALRVVRIRPGAYLNGLFDAWVRHFLPATESDWLAGNRQRIRALDRIYTTALCGRFVYDRWPASPEVVDPRAEMGPGRKLANTGLFLLVGCPLLFAYGLVRVRRAWRRDPAAALTLLFIALNIAYVTVVGNALEVGENYRNRFTLSPFYLALLGLFLTGRLRRGASAS